MDGAAPADTGGDEAVSKVDQNVSGVGGGGSYPGAALRAPKGEDKLPKKRRQSRGDGMVGEISAKKRKTALKDPADVVILD